jgi:hypothetical protein
MTGARLAEQRLDELRRFLSPQPGPVVLHGSGDLPTPESFLVDPTDLDRWMGSGIHRPPAMQPLRDGSPVPAATFTRPVHLAGKTVRVCSVGAILDGMEAGDILVVNNAYRLSSAVRAFARRLEDRGGGRPVGVRAFFSLAPGTLDASAFAVVAPPVASQTTVFVQCFGRSRFTRHGETVELCPGDAAGFTMADKDYACEFTDPQMFLEILVDRCDVIEPLLAGCGALTHSDGLGVDRNAQKPSEPVPPRDVPPLEWCFGAREPDLARAWSERPLIVTTAQRGPYGPVLDLPDLDALLGGLVRPPILEVVVNGQRIDGPAYTRTITDPWGSTEHDLVAPDEVTRLFGEGATLVVNALHLAVEPVARLARLLEAEMGCPVQANAYMTPANGQGFDPHWDSHDVIVVQCHGSKRWVLWPPIEPWPVNAGFPSRPVPPAQIVDLHRGDVLYLPRGWVHAASCADEASVHVTLGLLAWTNADLMKTALEDLTSAASTEAWWRRPLLPGALRELSGALPQRLAALVAGVPATPSKIYARLRERLERQRVPSEIGQVRDRVLLRTAAKGVLEIREGVPFSVRDDPGNDHRCIITVLHRAFSAPRAIAKALEQNAVQREPIAWQSNAALAALVRAGLLSFR